MLSEKLLIVDDEEDLLLGLSRMLAPLLPEVDISMTSNERQALRRIGRSQIDLVLLDIRMPEIDGLDLLKVMLKEDPCLTVVMMTGHGTIELAVEAMKRGAYDFITKPFDKENLVRILKKGLERNRLLRENHSLKLRVGQGQGLEGLVGQSAVMRRLYAAIQTTARTDYAVLIQGESGTGKELTAQALHNLGKRAGQPMVTVNCPAVPEHLLESELFGHMRGAFTGAARDYVGLFEKAHKNSIFLDEIGDLPVTIQTKLLRVLQEGEIKPLGSNKTKKVDVRVIAATNKDLEEAMTCGSFREDLYYRLNVVQIRTPSLREIREDVPLLVNHFTRVVCAELDMAPKRFTAEALETLMNRSWPGNVRELQNVIRRVVMFAADETITGSELIALLGWDERGGRPVAPNFESGPGTEPYKKAKDRVLNQFTMEYVTALLEDTGGNVTRAAELSGLGRASLQKIMRRLGIKSESYKAVQTYL